MGDESCAKVSGNRTALGTAALTAVTSRARGRMGAGGFVTDRSPSFIIYLGNFIKISQEDKELVLEGIEEPGEHRF